MLRLHRSKETKSGQDVLKAVQLRDGNGIDRKTRAVISKYTFETQDDIIAGGVGGRYLFLPDEGLWLGVVVARGPEDTYMHITVGHTW